MTREDFCKLTEKQVVLLDGATGSELRRAGMPRDAVAEAWVLAHPQILTDLQRAYIEAGSRIIYAPTFQAVPAALEKAGLDPRQTEETNRRLVGLSRQASAGKALVAGDVTTMAASLDVLAPENYARILEGYRRQLVGILEGGADLIGAETLLYPHEAELIWEAAALEGLDVPVMYCFTMDAYGCFFSGREAGPVLRELEEAGAAAVGFNCVAAGEELPALVSRLRRYVRGPLISKPNAGDPVVQAGGVVEYPMGPGEFALHQRQAAELGATLLGGCCGTGPAFIQEIKHLLP